VGHAVRIVAHYVHRAARARDHAHPMAGENFVSEKDVRTMWELSKDLVRTKWDLRRTTFIT
jgi:hypothetical protein